LISIGKDGAESIDAPEQLAHREPISLGEGEGVTHDGLAGRVLRRDCDDGNVVHGWIVKRPVEQLEAIHVGHDEVEQHHVGMVLAENGQRLTAVSGQEHAIVPP